MGTLWFGGKIRTLIDENSTVEAVFVKNGIIEAVGHREELVDFYKKDIRKMEDLNGAIMYPGFIDSHLHMIGQGEKLLRLDLSNVTSVAELKEVLSESLGDLPKNAWLVGEGFNENIFTDEQKLDLNFLDRVTTDHPVALTRVCRHVIVTNSLGLKLAKIDQSTTNPQGGLIEKDERGLLTGYLHDQAMELLHEVMPKKDFTYIKKALETSLKDLYKHGYVGAHTEDLNYYGDPVKTLQTIYEVIDGEKNKFRTNLLIHHEVAAKIMSQDINENSFIQLGSVKIFADGALGGRTALLSKPYADDPTSQGIAIHTQEQLSVIVKEARNLQMPVAIHAIGDLALQYAIKAIEDYPPALGTRDRLIHLQVTRQDLLERLKKLPVVLDIQPRFVATDFPWVEERLGSDRLPYCYAWKRLLNEGLVCAGGSDAPIELVDPILGIHAAVTRRHPEDAHDLVYGKEERLSLFEALGLFTLGSAYAANVEDKQGLIKVGYRADFTILNQDLFELEPDDWLQVEVVKTVVDNTVMYEK